MDIVAALRDKIASLPPGDHALGLLAVETHIRCAVRHLARGQAEADDTAFTDAIYRCNQAFEGSMKEAFRVLADEEPTRKTPAQIEAFLTTNQLLRQRVLDQLTSYRQQWRNPSTHDYMLDFDAGEALLAIVSVTAFAIVLCDQMQTALVAKVAAEHATTAQHAPSPGASLQEQALVLIEEFARTYHEPEAIPLRDAGRNLEGALAGYLSAGFGGDAEVSVDIGRRFDGREADVAITGHGEQVAVEVKRVTRPMPSRLLSSLMYLDALMSRGVSSGIVLAFDPGDRDVRSATLTLQNGRHITVVMNATLFAASRDLALIDAEVATLD